jgi:hypothetical protein
MKKRHHGFGSLLYDFLQTVRLAGFAILLMMVAVGIVFYVLRFFAHLLRIR